MKTAVFFYAFFGWLLCALVMFSGMKLFSLQDALIFTGFVIFMDVFVVAMLVNKSFAMFSSILGTWLPFGLIFFSVWITTILENKSNG
jgi:hypothetical protein